MARDHDFVKFHAPLPGPDGQAWLVMPTVFDLQRPGGASKRRSSDDMYAWAAARVAREPQVEFKTLMAEMAMHGFGELAKEAANLLEKDDGKAGSSRLQVHPCSTVEWRWTRAWSS